MKKQILLIEDDKIVRENTAEILQFANYEVITASDGKIGLEKALHHTPDLIVCDIMMPKLDGYGVYKILTKDVRCERIPFIFLTAKTNHQDRRKGMELGADDYLTKPFDESELLSAIEIRLKKATNNNKDYAQNGVDSNTDSFAQIKNIDALIKILNNKENHSYNKGETLFCEGNTSNHVFLVKEGSIKTYKNTDYGKELITGLFEKNSFIGYTSSLGDFPYRESAEAINDSKVIKIDKIEIKNILNKNPHLAIDIIGMLSNNIEKIKNKMLQIAYESVRKRVAKTLLLIIKDDPLKKILLSRSNLANLVGIARETLIRTLADFKQEGLLETNRTYIKIIDENGLQKIK